MNLLLLAWSYVLFSLYAEGRLDIIAVNVTAIVAVATAVTVTVTVVMVILTCIQHGDYSAATHRTFDAATHRTFDAIRHPLTLTLSLTLFIAFINSL